MKSKFLFVMSVAATMLLASCNNMPAESSQPAASDDTSTSATQGQVISIRCAQTEETLHPNETLQLSVTVEVTGGASNKATYSTSNADVASVNDAGLVTAKAVGDATITIKARADETKTCSVTIHVAATQYAAINTVDTTKEYTVRGKVIGITTRSYVVADETGSILVYTGSAPSVSLGEVYKITGTPTAYAGFAQFGQTAVAEKLDNEAVVLPDAVELNSTIVDGWLATYNAAEDTGKQFLTQDKMKLYKWDTVVGEMNGYSTINVEGSDVPVEAIYVDGSVFTLTRGKKYHVEGVYVGYRVPSSGPGYAQIVLTKAEEKAAEVGDVSIASAEDATTVKVDADLELTASIYGVENQSVTWGFKDGETVSQTSEFATLTPDNENGNKVKLHGVKAGKVIVVATYEQKSAEMEITIESNAVNKTIKEINALNEIINLDVTVVAPANTGYIVADASGYLYVRDGNHTPAVGDHLNLEAKVAAYNGGLQVTVNKYEVVTEGTAPVGPEAVAITEADVNAILPLVSDAKSHSTFEGGEKIKLYSFENVSFTQGSSAAYMFFDVGSAHCETTSTANSLLPVEGKNYDMTAIPFGYYKDKQNVEYVTFIVVSLTERAAEAGTVTIEGPTSVNVNESIELTASVAGSDAATVSWTFADGTMTSDYATLVPGNDNKVTVTGVAAGSVTVKATAGDKSAEHTVQVKAAPQPGSLVAATIAKGTTNSYDDVTVNGKFAVKAGKSSAGGNLTITVGAGANKLVFHAVAWKGESANITLSGATIDPSTVAIVANDAFSGTAKEFTVDDEDAYKFEVDLSGIEAETVITITTAKRAVVWDAFYGVAN